MNKCQSEFNHAINRAKERYNENFGLYDIEVFVKKIQRSSRAPKCQGKWAKLLYIHTNEKSVWKVIHRNKEYKVVFNKNTKTIVTFLPI